MACGEQSLCLLSQWRRGDVGPSRGSALCNTRVTGLSDRPRIRLHKADVGLDQPFRAALHPERHIFFKPHSANPRGLVSCSRILSNRIRRRVDTVQGTDEKCFGHRQGMNPPHL
ncbi:hypothetical protein J6590_018095 [Homalodisca vitripennis]|nr:hypothetical protein J6590_018095 [Homalodisca vitripennis]